MGDKGKRDKGKHEKQKKAKLSQKEKRMQKRDKQDLFNESTLKSKKI